MDLLIFLSSLVGGLIIAGIIINGVLMTMAQIADTMNTKAGMNNALSWLFTWMLMALALYVALNLL